MTRPVSRARIAAFAAAAVVASAPASARLQLDYLAIRANEGGSAGGHAAIRFGDETFHFEHVEGLIRLEREDSRRFQHVYRTLQNRDIDLTRVPVSSETWRLLRDVFRRRALVQERQVAIAGELERDARLLESLLGADPALEVNGAGFFEAKTGTAENPLSSTGELGALRARIEELHGRDLLGRRRSQLARSLELLVPSVSHPAVPLSADRYPDFPVSYSRRVEDALAAQAALDLLAEPRPLAPQALARGWEGLPLDPAEEARLRQLAGELREQMARLAASSREDFGYPLLLGMARLAAIEISLRWQRLALLDPYPAQSRWLDLGARRRAHLPDLLGEARSDLEAARQRLRTSRGWREAEFSALEAAAGRWLELRAAEAGAASIRVQVGPLLPEARARVSLSGLPRQPEEIAPALAQTRAAEAAHREQLAALYGYDLLRRNCVSEIFRTLEAGLAQERTEEDSAELRAFVREESQRRLGGYVDPVGSFNFIPFVSSQRVRSHWRVGAQASLPSYRHHRLAEMAAREPGWLVALRESNVLTARSHQAADAEGFFLFFTDTSVAARPLLGAVNLGAGLLRSTLAIAELPFDGGRGLRSGLTGVLYSFPELLFQNIRKGYNEYVPPGERPPPG